MIFECLEMLRLHGSTHLKKNSRKAQIQRSREASSLTPSSSSSWISCAQWRVPTGLRIDPRHGTLPIFNDELAGEICRQLLNIILNPVREFHPIPPVR